MMKDADVGDDGNCSDYADRCVGGNGIAGGDSGGPATVAVVEVAVVLAMAMVAAMAMELSMATAIVMPTPKLRRWT